MAAISAGEVDSIVAGKCFCAMLSACDRAGDVQRAAEWSRILIESVLEPNDGNPRILHTHCREAYGSVLCTIGRWDDGEAAILDALGPNASRSEGHRVEATARLAELRLLQGRAEEAASLLRPYEDRLSACGPLARLHVMQGELDLAAATILRGLGELNGDRLRESVLLSQLVEIQLARDDVAAATVVCDRLVANASVSDTPILQAMGSLACGRVAIARDDHSAATVALESALDSLADEERPVLRGTIRYETARVLAWQGDTAAAISEARAALAIFERVGAVVEADRTAAFLRNLGSRAPARGRQARDRVDSLTSP